MAPRTVTIVPVGSCIRYKGVNYLPTDPFACEPNEAKRLIDMGVAVAAAKVAPIPAAPPAPSAPPAQSDQSDRSDQSDQSDQSDLDEQPADLLAQISAAATKEDLLALIPTEEPADAEFAAKISGAAKARMAELEA